MFRLDLKTNQVVHYGVNAGLTNERVDKLFWDKSHRLWATTRGGLFRANPVGDHVRFQLQPMPYSDPNEAFYGYLLDHHGRLWVGGSRGLVVLEHEQWRRFSKADGLIGDGVSQIAETPDGAIWLGYLTNSGVSRLVYENGKSSFSHVTTSNGLTSNGSVFLGVDSRGWLWVGTDDGADVRTRWGWRHYGKSDGLVWDDCDALAFHADLDGAVWIGTSGGFSRFKPASADRTTVPVSTFITSFRTASGAADTSHPAPVSYKDRSLQITFASPTFLNEEAVRFRYRMAGFEKDWIDTDERSVRYANLPAGNYRFEVTGRNAQRQWSPRPAAMSFTIVAPWWQTWKFRIFVGLLLSALAHRFWRYRIQYLVQRQEQLETLLFQAQTADRLKSEALVKITRGEARERNRSQILEMVGSHEPLETILDSIVRMVEADDPDTYCLILVLRGGCFHHGASRNLPARFARAFEGFTLDSNSTCFALAAYRVETIEVKDMGASPLWEAHQEALSELEFTFSRSAPIVSNSAGVLGTITFFRKAKYSSANGYSNFLESAARLANIAMEHLSLYEQLSFRAQYDVLTELPNRVLFDDRLQQAIIGAERHGTKLAVLMLDLDGFKFVNDSLGHHAGDILLQTVAKRIQACLRRDDTAARIGGDEFVILLETQECADVEMVVQKLIAAINEPIPIGDREVAVTASVGVSIFPDDSSDPTELVKNADVAMYSVKRLGKNAHDFFVPAMASEEAWRIEIESHLRNALPNNEFELDYQPQYDLHKKLVGFEALLRWNNPILGSISPLHFIPVAEAVGLIVPLGRWVLEEACRQSAAWTGAGYADVRIAVNVSACQFARADFPETVAQSLKSTGVPPRNIELELTETAIMKDVIKSSAQLLELRDSGVSVAIDDFGTGYSSLSYLQRLPVDSIKVDQSFIRDLGNGSSNSVRMIQAIVNLAHDLDLRVIAEGVESAEQFRILQELNCDLAQGYLLGRPLHAEDATELLARHAEEKMSDLRASRELLRAS